MTNEVRLQIGANGDANSAITVDTSFRLGDLYLDLSDTDTAAEAIDTVDKLLDTIGTKLSYFGAVMNRLDSVSDAQTTQIENLTAARSTILDADIAQEAANYTRAQILQQTSAALLAQTKNVRASLIMSLLQ